ncbi:hypothetical protein [Marinicellulosiphila megalodicopiae]|uniref:hypothetical protein n=1 Tax=Marinicellulosiphila megalodicopiae TaxID=2724896 RepID=UPI003BB008A9
MKLYNTIAERIEILEEKVALLNDEIATLQTAPRNDREKIIFKFLETGSTGKTKDFVREMGIKSSRGGLYSSGDVSKLIKDGADDISPKLLELARLLATGHNKNGPSR